MQRSILLAVICLLAAGCNASTWQALLPAVLGTQSSTAPPIIRGKVYGNAVGPKTKVAIKSIIDPDVEKPAGIVFAAVTVEGGAYKFEFPKTYNEQFELFAFQDDNDDGLVGPEGATATPRPDQTWRPEQTSIGGRCGKVTVVSPTRSTYNNGAVLGKWTLTTCNEEEGPPSTDFGNADIRFSH